MSGRISDVQKRSVTSDDGCDGPIGGIEPLATPHDDFNELKEIRGRNSLENQTTDGMNCVFLEEQSETVRAWKRTQSG